MIKSPRKQGVFLCPAGETKTLRNSSLGELGIWLLKNEKRPDRVRPDRFGLNTLGSERCFILGNASAHGI